MALEQKYLNVTTRAEGYLDILMYIPDEGITISSVSCDDVLSYSNINSITNIKNYSTQTLATLEENLWVLDGSFINPTPGRTYNGYVSNSMSDENGDFETNPKIRLELTSSSDVEYFSVTLNPSVRTAYPKNLKVTFYDTNRTVVKTMTKNLEETEGVDNPDRANLPNVIYDVDASGVKYVEIEFIGTLVGHRRARLSTIMFGRILTLTQDEILSSDYLDTCSYVPDSIPSRTFSFDLENYDGRYNIDNPENALLTLDSTTRVLIRNGYNVYGYTEDQNEHYIDNPDEVVQIEWDDWKELRLLDVSTSSENTCTMQCGSILDAMTDVYTQERFEPNRTVGTIVGKLLDFLGMDRNIVVFSSDDGGVGYDQYTINTPLPELPVRELLQLLAFSVGATLLIKDDGTIKFANLNILDSSTFTNHHSFSYRDFASVPAAEQLEATSKVSLPKYNATVESAETDISTVAVSTYEVEVSYPECVPTTAVDKETGLDTGIDGELFCRKGYLDVTLGSQISREIVIKGHKIDVLQTQDRTVTKDTLIIDTQLMASDPNNVIKNKYKQWYSKKFKYTMNTRGEPLVDAGDWAVIQSPFSERLNCYVLKNHIKFDGAWSGDMEVIAL